MAEQSPEEVLARFEELTVMEADFEDAENELLKHTNTVFAPLYKKRAALIAKIPHFWALVLEEAPPELDNYIQPSDSKIFAEALETLEVRRFDVDNPKGSPRSFSIKWGFKPNDYFEDTSLEKKFWYRRSLDGCWDGLVSEPVKIHWKDGQDPTGGLTDAAYDLHQARLKLSEGQKESELKEAKAIAEKIEENNEDATLSFFGFFGYISSWKWVSAEENEKACKIWAEKMEKRRKGEMVEEDDDDEEMDEDVEDAFNAQDTEVFPNGDELATLIVEDIWPSAINYFKRAHDDEDDEELSDLDIEDMDEDDESDEEVDLRALVGKGKKEKGSVETPPAKRRREA